MLNDTVTLHDSDSSGEVEALRSVISALQGVNAQARDRILKAAATFLEIGSLPLTDASEMEQAKPISPSRHVAYSADTSMSPKEFLLEKQPRTDVERIACLAYYLTHYRDTPHFKTIDLSKLNTEAAQPKFANAANAASNGVKTGYLVASSKGNRQISAAGERFVQALPDRAAARDAMGSIRKRRRSKRPKSKRGSNE